MVGSLFQATSCSSLGALIARHGGRVRRDRFIYSSRYLIGVNGGEQIRNNSKRNNFFALAEKHPHKSFHNNMVARLFFSRGGTTAGSGSSVSASFTHYLPHIAAGIILLFMAASVQAFVVYRAFQKNTRGKLVVPPGATQGEEIHDAPNLQDNERPANDILAAMKNSVNAAYQSTRQKLDDKRMELRVLLQPKKTESVFERQGSKNHTYKIIVIGDSLACGVGCVNKWDQQIYAPPSKDNADKETEDFSSAGPVFPRVLAYTLSQRLQSNVRWRSAGVVGGCVEDIKQECMHIIQQEVVAGNAPDVVVVLCGLNDMKHHIAHLIKAASDFRDSLRKLCEEIHKEAPTAQVVLPAVPVLYELNSTNMLLVFPLALFFDFFTRYWDLQKRRVAKQLDRVTFVGRPDSFDVFNSLSPLALSSSPSLTAEDGVHPSDYGYFVWAQFLGYSLVDKLRPGSGNTSQNTEEHGDNISADISNEKVTGSRG